MNTPAHRCRHCGTPLTALQQRQGSSCGAAACRHRDAQARLARLEQTVGRDALDAARAMPQGGGARLLWLSPAPQQLVPVAPEQRAAFGAHLQQLLEQPADDTVQPLAPAAPATSLGAQEGRLCAQCGGRCCGPGLARHGFLSLPQLLRWQQAHPGSSLEDATAAFLQCLPADHMDGSCLYLGDTGCALPREDRSDICNSYCCDALVELQHTLADTPDAAFVAVTLDADEALRRALITADGSQPLP